MLIHRSASDAYRAALHHLFMEGMIVPSTSDPDSPGSNFGEKERMTKTLIGQKILIRNPRDRLVNVAGRRPNPVFAVANSLWILGGRGDLEFIQYYNPRGKDFSDDGTTLYGAYGHRLFHEPLDQMNGLIERLKKDRYTRRAFATVALPRDSKIHSHDIPCLLSVQFHHWKNRLDMIATMRSQSAAMVLPYDLFAFTFLHEAVAAASGFELGTYHHDSGSFHYYMDEEPLVEKVLKGSSQQDTLVPVPQMPSENVWGNLSHALNLEAHIRARTLSLAELHEEKLPDYWKGLLYLLGVQTWGRTEEVLRHVPAYYRAALI